MVDWRVDKWDETTGQVGVLTGLIVRCHGWIVNQQRSRFRIEVGVRTFLHLLLWSFWFSF